MSAKGLLTSHRMCVTALRWLFVITLLVTSACCVIVDRRMTTPAQCPGKVVATAHRYRTVVARSALECVGLCRPFSHCLSALFDVDKRLCHLGNATSDESCSKMEPAVGNMKYYEMTNASFTCENGGVINPDGKSCACPELYYGVSCDEVFSDCETYVDKGVISTGNTVKYIKPTLAPEPFNVTCNVLSNGLIRTVILTRNDVDADFNRTFNEYRDGFGGLRDSTYWIGLERLYQLTGSKTYQLRISVKLSNGTRFNQNYFSFVVADEAAGYPFNFGHTMSWMDLGDCLEDLRGAKFSAYDVDNDGSAIVHCARLHGGGWWFKGDSCSTCNPFGPILAPFEDVRKGVPGEAFWTNNLGDAIPFKLSATLVSV